VAGLPVDPLSMMLIFSCLSQDLMGSMANSGTMSPLRALNSLTARRPLAAMDCRWVGEGGRWGGEGGRG